MMGVCLKMEKMTISAEDAVSRMRIALTLGDIEKVYEILRMKIPPKIRVA